MLTIPALFATSSDGALFSEECWFRRAVPVPEGGRMPFQETAGKLPKTEQREDVVVVDADSLRARSFIPDVLKEMRVRGKDIWLLTWIENADDLFDAFNTTAEKVIGPYQASSSDKDLKDILSVSDSFVPAVFVCDGMAISREGSREDLRSVADRLCSVGFAEIVVADTDGSVTGQIWEELPWNVIPFVRRNDGTMPDGRIIVPFGPEGCAPLPPSPIA